MIDLKAQERVIRREQLRYEILTHINEICGVLKKTIGNNYDQLETTALSMYGAKGAMYAKWNGIKKRYDLSGCNPETVARLDDICSRWDLI